MKKLVLVYLSMFTSAAWAELVKVGETMEETFYVDRAAIPIDGNFRKVWRIQNAKGSGSSDQASNRVRIEFDCAGKRTRLISFGSPSELMAGGGSRNIAKKPDGWIEIKASSIAEATLKVVCTN